MPRAFARFLKLRRRSAVAPVGQRHIASLDGLRGIAAFVVVVSHALLAGIAYSHLDLRDVPVWLGNFPVMIFFVLSGFVLTRPLAGGGRFDAGAYYPARLFRLYLPVWGAVLVGAALHATTWKAATGASWWLNAHLQPITAGAFERNDTLIFQSGGFVFASALWSLRWEVIFSLLLPVYVWAAKASRGRPGIALAVTLGLIVSGASQYTAYLPVFFLGSVLAVNQARAAEMWQALSGTARGGVAILTVAMLAAGSWAPDGTEATGGIAPMLVASGALMTVAIACSSRRGASQLTRPSIQWLGSRSFSLYLIHEPVLVTLALVTNADLPAVALIALALPLALASAEVFFRVVEHPSHRLSRRVASTVRSRRAAVAAST